MFAKWPRRVLDSLSLIRIVEFEHQRQVAWIIPQPLQTIYNFIFPFFVSRKVTSVGGARLLYTSIIKFLFAELACRLQTVLVVVNFSCPAGSESESRPCKCHLYEAGSLSTLSTITSCYCISTYNETKWQHFGYPPGCTSFALYFGQNR